MKKFLVLIALVFAFTVFAQNTEAAEGTDPYGNRIADGGEDSGYFPLYSMLPSEGIYLYGVKPYGWILYRDGKGTYFDWPGITPRFILPEMLYRDFDGSGERDLAVLLYVGSGTGFSMMDLHILTVEENENDWSKPIYTDHALLGKDVDEWMDEKISLVPEKENNEYRLDFCGKNYTVKLNVGLSEIGEVTDLGYGDIVSFSFDGSRIKTTIAVGAFFESMMLEYFGDIEADVVFDGKKFKLENHTFVLY